MPGKKEKNLIRIIPGWIYKFRMKKQENKKGLSCYCYPWAFVTRKKQIQKKTIYTTTNKLNGGEVTEVSSFYFVY